MILKYFEISKINTKINNLVLFYGKNEGLKNEMINTLFKNKKEISSYEEKEILENQNNFTENILTKSLFETEKNIIIRRATDKIYNIVKELSEKNIDDTTLLIISDNLEKKSKLRSFFEKDKKYICIPFYEDNKQTLSKLANNFFRDKKISISSENINLIINKCNGDRKNLLNELDKLEHFSKNKKNITTEIIIKLVNLAENHSISELIDNCLAKNKKETIKIINENNFSDSDCILITRTFLNKSKKILKLSKEYSDNKNIDLTISAAKPPIFWKDKEIIKQQITKWTPENIKKLIYKLNEIELNIKKNINSSAILITDFIIRQSSTN